jgi:2-keto-4-pentenoate hydratase/2-oxohepta-3-ene-1,7-dioic acid hydratase in catechol pathway
MKLISFQLSSETGRQVRIGAVTGAGRVIDLEAGYRLFLLDSGTTERAAARISSALLPSDMVAFIEGGRSSMEAAQQSLAWAARHGDIRSKDGVTFAGALDDLVLLAPVPRPPLMRDFMGFETHLKNIYPKLGLEIPPEWYNIPVYYKGNAGSVSGHDSDILIPSFAESVDFEFEIAVVIGDGGINIPADKAMDHVFGYTIYNDFSARAIQNQEMSVGLGPAKGKDFAGAHVIGPWIVTADEIDDIYNLKMVARVNGEIYCDTHSSTNHWHFKDMIAHASMDETIYPGEIMGSGTVGGGSGIEGDRFLNSGDVIELEMEGIGTLRNKVVGATLGT